METFFLIFGVICFSFLFVYTLIRYVIYFHYKLFINRIKKENSGRGRGDLEEVIENSLERLLLETSIFYNIWDSFRIYGSVFALIKKIQEINLKYENLRKEKQTSNNKKNERRNSIFHKIQVDEEDEEDSRSQKNDKNDENI